MNYQDIVKILSDPRFFTLFIIWSIFWKGLALWKSARNKHLSWFILIFIINTLGLFEIAYVFFLFRYDFGSKALLKFLEKYTTLKKGK